MGLDEFYTSDIGTQIFNDDGKLEDYDTVASVFRIVPAEIQDLMWENVPTQKILLGMGKVTDEELTENSFDVEFKDNVFFAKYIFCFLFIKLLHSFKSY